MWQKRPRSVRRDYSRKSYSNPLFERRGDERSWLRRLRAALIVLALAGGGWWVLYSGRFAAAQIDISGNTQLTEWELRDGVQQSLTGFHWLIVPRNNLLFLSERDLADKLNQKFVLESVTIHRHPLERKLAVEISERVSSIIVQFADGSQATLDLEGEVTRTLPADQAVTLFPPMGPNPGPTPFQTKLFALYDDKNESVDLRQKAVAPSVVSAVIALPDLIGSKFGGGSAVRLHVDDRTSTTIRAITGEGWTLYLDATQPLQPQIDNADVVMRTKVGNDRPRLDYIDVRFGDKVFFKLK